jgi:hypothetical protein
LITFIQSVWIKRNWASKVKNLNTALDMFIEAGAVEGDIVEDDETGKRRADIPISQLPELWYTGLISG